MKQSTIDMLRLVTPYVLFVAAVFGYLIRRHYEKLDTKVERLEKDLQELKEDLPKDYVLKDDNIIAMARLDKVMRDVDSKVTKLLTRGGISES